MWFDLTCTADEVNHAAVLAPYVNDDTFAVGYLNVASLAAPGSPDELFQLLPKLPEEAQSQLVGVVTAGKTIQTFKDAGGQGLYVVAGLGDVHENGGPIVVATAANGRPARVEESLKGIVQGLGDDAAPIEVRRRGDVVLVGSKATVERYAMLAKGERNDLIEPLTRLTGEGAVVAGVFLRPRFSPHHPRAVADSAAAADAAQGRPGRPLADARIRREWAARRETSDYAPHQPTCSRSDVR